MIFSVIILAISLSLDAFGVGIAYGLRKIQVPIIQKLIICIFSIIYSAIALIIGKWLYLILPPSIAKYIGFIILILMGMCIIIQTFINSNNKEMSEVSNIIEDKTIFKIGIKSLGITIHIIRNPKEGDMDRSGIIDISESILLGLALSVDAIGVSIGSALTGFHSMMIPLIIGLFQLIFLCSGLYLGKIFALAGKIDEKLLSIIPGILLIFLAVIRIS